MLVSAASGEDERAFSAADTICSKGPIHKKS